MGNAKLPADRSGKPWTDLLVPWQGRDLLLRPAPLGVLRSTDLAAAMAAQVALQVAALHAAATKRRCSRSA